MTNDTPDPAWDRLVGHIPLSSGEVTTVHVDGDMVDVSLYAWTAKPADDNAMVTPALLIRCTADEAEALAELVMLGAVHAHNNSRRPKLRVVKDEDGDD